MDINELTNNFFDTWTTMIKGDFDAEKNTFNWRIFFFILTFLLNVILLNILVAILSDSYESVMTYISEKSNKEKNSLIHEL